MTWTKEIAMNVRKARQFLESSGAKRLSLQKVFTMLSKERTSIGCEIISLCINVSGLRVFEPFWKAYPELKIGHYEKLIKRGGDTVVCGTE